MESFWKQVKSQMKTLLPDHSYRMWIQPVQYLGTEENVIRLSCPNAFSKKRITDNYLAGLKAQLAKAGCSCEAIDLIVEKKGEKRTSTPKAVTNGGKKAAPGKLQTSPGAFFSGTGGGSTPRQKQMTLPGLDIRSGSGRMLKKNYTFDDFVVGDNSNFAYSASLSLAHGGQNGNNALYLLSDTGLGKSHLSQAVGHHVMSETCSRRVYYVTAEDFTNEMVSALRNNTILQFKEKYRQKCDVLILEDIHFLSGKSATQKELAMTLDYLMDADKKIIFSGCYLPADIPKLNEQLRSRLTMGLVTKIDVPDFSTRVKILNRKSRCNGYKIPGDVTDYIAQELCDNVRQLESGLTGVAARAGLLGETIDVDLAKSVLANIARTNRAITIDRIKQLVCSHYNISEEEIVSKSRAKRIVKPRQKAIYLARKYTDQPLKKIGRSFKKYHATAIYSINAVEKDLKLQGSFAEEMNYLVKKLETKRQ